MLSGRKTLFDLKKQNHLKLLSSTSNFMLIWLLDRHNPHQTSTNERKSSRVTKSRNSEPTDHRLNLPITDKIIR